MSMTTGSGRVAQTKLRRNSPSRLPVLQGDTEYRLSGQANPSEEQPHDPLVAKEIVLAVSMRAEIPEPMGASLFPKPPELHRLHDQVSANGLKAKSHPIHTMCALPDLPGRQDGDCAVDIPLFLPSQGNCGPSDAPGEVSESNPKCLCLQLHTVIP